MSEIIDRVMVLFLKHKGRETRDIFRSMNRAAAAAAAALTAETGLLRVFLLEPPVRV